MLSESTDDGAPTFVDARIGKLSAIELVGALAGIAVAPMSSMPVFPLPLAAGDDTSMLVGAGEATSDGIGLHGAKFGTADAGMCEWPSLPFSDITEDEVLKLAAA